MKLAEVRLMAWLSVAVAAGSVRAADTGIYRTTVLSPPIYRESTQAAVLDFGTKLASIQRAAVRITGIHTNGWWVGDPTENPIECAMGASIIVSVFGGAGSVAIPGHLGEDRFIRGCDLTNDGPFTITLSLLPDMARLRPRGYVPDWCAGLCCERPFVNGLGGFAVEPFLHIEKVDVELEAEPLLEITSAGADGSLSWSALPAGGTIEILAADASEGQWQVEARLPSDMRSTTLLRPQPGTSRLYRLRWWSGAAP
jgi:hypothetical protein